MIIIQENNIIWNINKKLSCLLMKNIIILIKLMEIIEIMQQINKINKIM